MASTGFQSRLQQKEKKKTMGVQLRRKKNKRHKQKKLMTNNINTSSYISKKEAVSFLSMIAIRFSQAELSPVHQSFPRTAAKGKQVRFDSSNKENIQKGMVSYRR